MQCFNAQDWFPFTGSADFILSRRTEVHIRASCAFPLSVIGVITQPNNVLSGANEGAEHTVLHTGTNINFKAILEGYDLVRIEGEPDIPFGCAVQCIARQVEEPHDPSIQVPHAPMPGPTENLLLQIKRMMDQERKRTSTPVFEPEEGEYLRRYEIDDDDDLMFEEDLISLAERKRAEAKASETSPEATATADSPDQQGDAA